MALLSVTEAAQLVGVSRKTIYRQLESGKLSAAVTDNEHTKIETAELFRVYGEQVEGDGEQTEDEPPKYIGELLEQLARMQDQISELSREIVDLKTKLTEPQSKGFFSWVKPQRKG
ncbi:DNA-binding protein [Salmonella enterica subsp. enterica serovar Lexington]|uniref:Helix-turn-helix domain-containing protein n=1 Tax=Salmonella enterica TaxID=28901 RepID=A0A5Y5T9X8_SALER|nr:DNA-binding protein [Salmonella enterica subsp. enterica serovar Weltevreden]EAC0964203.1 DNA-binding protein [Salmonella enterica subsp. enterica serovar Newport]EAM2795153.1 DNA-binding protein [Salmonella enterica]EBR9008037.1 DNA-binding protein [Salmonella enterica subsp. enterica serovar Richmond]EBU7427034.1 DNA-binding protein [Salmonella enterica subsp. enterica serovar Lexington]EBU7739002.1 DNA-binding protein [Salmonella enterica subsp. enterica serovar Bareilly]EBX4401904.1 DN